MKKSNKSSKNVEQAVPFTAAQNASFKQAQAQADKSIFGAQPQAYLPRTSEWVPPAQKPNPFDTLSQIIMQSGFFGQPLTTAGGPMDQAAARDSMRTRMEQRTRWGNSFIDESGEQRTRNIIPKSGRK